jgi:hypothetical protein
MDDNAQMAERFHKALHHNVGKAIRGHVGAWDAGGGREADCGNRNGGNIVKKIGKNIFESDMNVDDAEKVLKSFAKEEILVMRVDKKRKAQIRKRASKAGVSMSAYLLMAEDFFAHVKG